tara:strand:+ start:2645 stop:4420 length:1776 start_codon:yes stop_codon:yes gene_type:complete
MKLNKFFEYKIHNRLEGEDLGGSGFSGGPVTLTLAQIQAELDGLDAKLESRGLQGDALTAAREQARAELVKLMRENEEINFSEEDFAKAVGLTPAQATAQYYTYDFTDKDYLFPKSGDYGVVIRSAFRDYDPDSEAAYEARGGKSVFATKPDSSFTPPDVTLEDVRVATDFAAPTPDQLATRLDAFLPRDRQVARVTQNTPAFTVADKLGTTMFDRINFPERTINRGVPVVTKGIDAQGNPTTGITMGTAAASPSGPTIGELDISAILPSTGMGINADGTGTTTVGTQPTTGNIVASSADTLNMVDPGVAANPISTIDPNVLGTQGNTVTKGPITTVTPPTPPTIDPPQQPSRAEVIQNLFNTSQTKDIAAQRIGDYAASVGGITAEEIAEAVKPVLGQQPTFGISPNTGAADVLEAVDRFGYGTKTPIGMLTTGVDNYSPIYGSGTTPPMDLETLTAGFEPDLAGKQAALQFLNTQDAAIGTGPYTEQEAAMRGLDYARRQGMSLADAGAAFGMSADEVRDRAGDLEIDLAQFGYAPDPVGFAHGGEVEDSRDAAVGSRLMAQAGIGSMQAKNMSPEMADSLDRIMARRK